MRGKRQQIPKEIDATSESGIIDTNWHIGGNSPRSKKTIDKNPEECEIIFRMLED